ncbi:hypothetical protein VTK73DRAFT_9504 [Phialemonium thermophilum]|uniref:SUZ domain-containing protein n=1 Tax=Phialemonium thermophilum TaxID=223376 RepID=A0ABR3Y5R4_9PEZI
MAKQTKVPDAWDDDDWEQQADKLVAKEEEEPAEQPPRTKAERLAKHAEVQRQLWESAETPTENIYVAANNNLPLTTGFKPAVKLLSRKPAPKVLTKRDPVTGLEKLTLQDEDEEGDKSHSDQLTPEEIKMRKQKELEEKQRRYEEARAKIFGDSSNFSRVSTPGNVTPPSGSEGRQYGRGRGRGRAGGSRRDSRQDNRQDNYREQLADGRDTHNRRVVGRMQTGPRELYDPNYSPKPESSPQNAGSEGTLLRLGRLATPLQEDQIIREPIGPNGSGGRGFGFARRETKES